MADINVKIPSVIEDAHKNNYIYGVILFGSTTDTNQNSNDIDLAIVTKVGKCEEFLNNVFREDDTQFDGYDISVIKIEDIDTTKPFYFGPHGHYLVESLRDGACLLGVNPFEDFPLTSLSIIQKSIVERLKDYMYVLRKSYFNHHSHEVFLKTRYYKFIKLSVFLLLDGYIFPDIMELPHEQALSVLQEYSYIEQEMTPEQIIEQLWQHISKKFL